MSRILKNLNIREKTYEVLFFSGVFFLFTVVYFGGILNTLYFFFYLERNFVYTIVPKIIFILLVIIQLCVPTFGKNLVVTLLDPVFVQKYKQKIENLSYFFTHYPFLSFLFIHILLCLTFLHYFTLYFADPDIFIEIFYYLFNLIKLIFIPLYIFSFIVVNLPNSFLTSIDASFEVTKEAIDLGKKALQQTVELAKKYPKTGGTMVAGAGAAATLVVMGKQQKDEVERAAGRCDPGSYDPAALYNNPDLQVTQDRLFDTLYETDKSPLVVGAQTAMRWVSGKESYSKSFHEDQKLARHQEIRTLGELAQQQELKEQQWREQAMQSGNIQKPKTDNIINSSSSGERDSLTEIPSCLESLYDFF